MGILQDLFGGSSTGAVGGITPGQGQNYVNALFNFDPNQYGGLAAGPFLKGAKQDYKLMRSGADISSIPGFSGTLGAINAAYASGDKVRNRQMGMNPALANQPELLAAQQADEQRQSNQDRANTIGNNAGGFYGQTQQFGQGAFSDLMQRRMLAANLKDQSLAQAGGLYSGFYRTNSNGGIIPGLASLGAGVGGAATGIGNAITACDERLKENIRDYTDGLEVIENLPVKKFEYNGLGGTEEGKQAIGVIAQDALEVDPGIVVPLGDTGYMAVDPQRLLFIAMNAIKELSAQVKELQARVSAHENEKVTAQG